MTYKGPDRRRLPNIREAVNASRTQRAAEINISMARMLGSDRLRRLNAGLPERRTFTNLRGLIDEIGCVNGKPCNQNVVELVRGQNKKKLARINDRIDGAFRQGMMLRREHRDDCLGLKPFMCAVSIINPNGMYKYSKHVPDPKGFRRNLDYLCGRRESE